MVGSEWVPQLALSTGKVSGTISTTEGNARSARGALRCDRRGRRLVAGEARRLVTGAVAAGGGSPALLTGTAAG